MNALRHGTAPEVLLQAGETLQHLGLDWEIREREPAAGFRRPDGVVRLQYPGGHVDLRFEVKVKPRKEQLGVVLGQRDPDQPPWLLVADYINPQLADWLREQGVMFLDVAGNAYLYDRGLRVWVTGKRDALRLQAERERRRAFQPSGLKVVFALLSRPGSVAADYRTLARDAGVALGTVQWVIRDLVEEGYVLRLGRRRRRLVEPKALLDAWVPAYLRGLRPRLLLGRFEAPDLDWWTVIDPREYGALWGGEPAAAKLTDHLKPGTLTIYTDRIPARLVVERRLTLNDAGRVEFRKKFWRFEAEDMPDTVPPVLVYADLHAVGDSRALEAAERVFGRRIDGLLRQHVAHRPS